MDNSINKEKIKEFADDGKIAFSDIVGEEVITELKDQFEETKDNITETAKKVVSDLSERGHQLADVGQQALIASKDQLFSIEQKVVSYVKERPVESLLFGAVACYAIKKFIQR